MTKLFKMQLAALAIFISSSVSADMSPGSFSMFTMVNGPTGSCDRGISLVLDHGQVLGDFAVLSNFVYGTCELFVPANPKFYKLELVEVNRCNHATYIGTRSGMNGIESITIIDGRESACSTSVVHQPKAMIELRLGDGEEVGDATFYSSTNRPMPLH
jgi:hypothetical protein